MKPVHVFDVWHIKEGWLDNILQLLAELAKKTREEKGNLFFNVHQIISTSNMIILFEGYTDPEAMEEHLDSPHLQILFLSGVLPFLEKREVTMVSVITEDEFPADHGNDYWPVETGW